MKSTIFFILFCGIALGNKSRSGTFMCERDVPYRENDCNYCYCDRYRLLICTSMACESHNNATYMKCSIGKMWNKKCNQCWCTKGGGTICTAYQCDPKNTRAKQIVEDRIW